jgi:hypothetical protein
MAAIDVMRHYLQAVQRGDWETGFALALRGDQIVEIWIFEANQYEVDDLFADPPAGLAGQVSSSE